MIIEIHSIILVFFPIFFLCVTMARTIRVHAGTYCVWNFSNVKNKPIFTSIFNFIFSRMLYKMSSVTSKLFQRRKKFFPRVSWFLPPHASKCNAILEKDESICQVYVLNFLRHVSICTNSILMSILSKYNFPFSFIWWWNFLIIITSMTLSADFSFAHANVDVQVNMDMNMLWSDQLGT